MKRSLLALAALTAFAGAASAQSSVTLFGVVDQSINYVKNGNVKSTSMQSNQLNSNRLGFRGIEDLGGGLKAGFWLEGGMSTQDGNAGGLTFKRRSTVSLLGNFGEIRLGRDYVPSFWNTVTDDVNGANGLGQFLNIARFDQTSASGILGAPGGNNFARDNNTVGYFLPAGLGGFYGQVMGALGQGTDGQKYYGGRLGWSAGPIDVNFGYGQWKEQAGGFGDVKATNAGGSYDFGVVKIYGVWNELKWGGAKQDSYGLNGSVPIGPGQFRAVYAHSKGTGGNGVAGDSFALSRIDGMQADLFSLEYVYDLSKRTSLYTTYGYIKNKNGAAFTVLAGSIGGGNGEGGAGADASLINGKSEGFNVGVRHSF